MKGIDAALSTFVSALQPYWHRPSVLLLQVQYPDRLLAYVDSDITQKHLTELFNNSPYDLLSLIAKMVQIVDCCTHTSQAFALAPPQETPPQKVASACIAAHMALTIISRALVPILFRLSAPRPPPGVAALVLGLGQSGHLPSTASIATMLRGRNPMEASDLVDASVSSASVDDDLDLPPGPSPDPEWAASPPSLISAGGSALPESIFAGSGVWKSPCSVNMSLTSEAGADAGPGAGALSPELMACYNLVLEVNGSAAAPQGLLRLCVESALRLATSPLVSEMQETDDGSALALLRAQYEKHYQSLDPSQKNESSHSKHGILSKLLKRSPPPPPALTCPPPALPGVPLRNLRPWSAFPVPTRTPAPPLSTASALTVTASGGYADAVAVLRLRTWCTRVLIAALSQTNETSRVTRLGCYKPTSIVHMMCCSDSARFLITSLFGVMSSFQLTLQFTSPSDDSQDGARFAALMMGAPRPSSKHARAVLEQADTLLSCLCQFTSVILSHPTPPQPLTSHCDAVLARPERARAVAASCSRYLSGPIVAARRTERKAVKQYYPRSRIELILLLRIILGRAVVRASMLVPDFDLSQRTLSPADLSQPAEIIYNASPILSAVCEESGRFVMSILDTVAEAELHSVASMRTEAGSLENSMESQNDSTMHSTVSGAQSTRMCGLLTAAPDLRTITGQLLRMMAVFVPFRSGMSARPSSGLMRVAPRTVPSLVLPKTCPEIQRPSAPLNMADVTCPEDVFLHIPLPPLSLWRVADEGLSSHTVAANEGTFNDLLVSFVAPRLGPLSRAGDVSAAELAAGMDACIRGGSPLSVVAADLLMDSYFDLVSSALDLALRTEIGGMEREGCAIAATLRTVSSLIDGLVRSSQQRNAALCLAILRRIPLVEFCVNSKSVIEAAVHRAKKQFVEPEIGSSLAKALSRLPTIALATVARTFFATAESFAGKPISDVISVLARVVAAQPLKLSTDRTTPPRTLSLAVSNQRWIRQFVWSLACSSQHMQSGIWR